jgi:hypothetical protein
VLPPALVSSTVKAALSGAVDTAVASGLISAQAAALAKGAMRTMSLTRWTVAVAGVVVLGVLGGGAGVLSHRVQAVEPAQGGSAAELPAAAKEEAVLRWTFQPDRPFYQEVTTETRQVLRVMGTGVPQTQKQTFIFSWTPEERDRRGNWVLKQKIEGIKLDLDISGNKISLDTTKDIDAANPLADFYKALVGAEFTVTLDSDSTPCRIRGADPLLKKLAGARPETAGVLGQVLSEDALRRVAEISFPALPDEAVQPGDSWTRKSQLDLFNLGKLDVTYRYTYEGKQDGLDRIRVESSPRYRGATDGAGSLPFTIKRLEIERSEGRGFMLFDRRKGRVARMELELKLRGPMDISIDKSEVGVVLEEVQKITVRTTDANPLDREGRRDDGELERLREENEQLRRKLRAVEEALQRDGKPKE